MIRWRNWCPIIAHFDLHITQDLSCGNLLGDRQKVYEDFMNGCRELSGAEACNNREASRLERCLNQPRSLKVRHIAEKQLRTIHVCSPAFPKLRLISFNFSRRISQVQAICTWRLRHTSGTSFRISGRQTKVGCLACSLRRMRRMQRWSNLHTISHENN